MKIIGKDGLEYETVEACEKADIAFDKQQEAEAEKEQKRLADLEQKKAELSKQKKEAADKVEVTDKNYQAALDNYIKVKQEGEEYIQQVRKDVNKGIREAAKEVEKASEERMNAIAEFNQEYGPYKTVLTGDKAKKEFDKFMDMFNAPFDKWFADFFRSIF